jgi:hypothetical protein
MFGVMPARMKDAFIQQKLGLNMIEHVLAKTCDIDDIAKKTEW